LIHLRHLALAAALGAGLFSSPGKAAGRDLAALTFSAPEDLGAPLKTVSVFNGGYGHLPGGKPVAAFTVKGSPGILYVVDAETRKLVFRAPLPGTDDASSAVEIARDGTVYAGGTAGTLYAWRAGAKQIERIGVTDKVILSLAEAPDGDLYMGTFPGGRLFRYAPKTRKMTDLGAVAPGEQYATSLAFDGDTLYVGIGAHPRLVRYDTRSGRRETVPLPPEVTEGGPNVGHLAVAGRRLFGMAGKATFALDLDTGRVVKTLPEGLAQGAVASPPRDGVTYVSVKPGTLLEYDLATDDTRPAPGFRSTSFTRDLGWLKIEGRERLVTISWSGGMWAYEPSKSQESYALPVEGEPVSVQAMEKGPDGRIYLSGYPGGVGARFDPANGRMETFALGQAEGIGALGNTLYFGIYPKASVLALDASAPLKAPVKAFDIGAEQDRPFAFATGAGKVFIGTVPGYGLLGGALTVYDPVSGKTDVHRNVIRDQSIIRLAYHDGLVYGSTSVWGGLGQPPAADAAVVFAWDPATGRLVRSAMPRHPGLKEAPKAINGLAFGPDGKLWAAWQNTVIRMDPRTLEVEAEKALGPSNWDVTHSWEPKALRFGRDGLLYTSLSGKLTVVDPETLEMRAVVPAAHVVLGDDGAIYVSHDRHLYRIRPMEARGTGGGGQ